MSDHSLVPVILAGGKGERFWPLSRKHRPKQFLSLDGSGRSLLQGTADRLLAIAGGWQKVWVITASHLADGVREQLPDLPEGNLLIEPEGRDTAPAVAWSTLEISRRYGKDAVLGFFPSDHWIADVEIFQATLTAATHLAAQKAAIVTLGIAPTFPSTGYGYIQQGEPMGYYGAVPATDHPGFLAYRVDRFTEKPDRLTANQFLASGNFSWNSGMFVFRAGVALDELLTYAPEIIGPLEAKGVSAYPALPKKSIDYALMEKTQQAYVLPVSFGWDDLGDWNAIERLLKGDNPNVELARHVGIDTHGALFYATDKDDLIVTIGLEDTVIVRDGKITLIVKKDRTQEIKHVLQEIQANPQFKDLL
ncbi:mannose-1-phosphate guanylyltransferase [Kovacikia minuta CCNUW1]|uniref:mannose-1-phosphate guanylyltransferase n=1 Tax=Kovacikia minuta TaxID=2931930 RepID=UPI001CCDED39|nr:mannose-1-phosphate guanylyltransferase [Kovacikia minuta]UBF27111.1 mannose-1-phosphate guanylyltransferase [Kovacikia minuta CCNUW1]